MSYSVRCSLAPVHLHPLICAATSKYTARRTPEINNLRQHRMFEEILYQGAANSVTDSTPFVDLLQMTGIVPASMSTLASSPLCGETKARPGTAALMASKIIASHITPTGPVFQVVHGPPHQRSKQLLRQLRRQRGRTRPGLLRLQLSEGWPCLHHQAQDPHQRDPWTSRPRPLSYGSEPCPLPTRN